MPKTGFEPVRRKAGDFKSPVSTVPPLGPESIIRAFRTNCNCLRFFSLSAIMQGMYTDSHFHILSMVQKGMDGNSLLGQMEKTGMIGLDIGTETGDLARRKALLSGHPSFLLTAGIGPWGVGQSIETLQSEIAEFGPVCAIGEIGLDNHWREYASKEEQEKLFDAQMELASLLHLPIIIHSREADMQMERILKRRKFSLSGIMHCFEGGRRLLDTALLKGFFISFSGVVTYKHNEWLQELCTLVPDDRLLLETDSPYLAPAPLRGKLNNPMHIAYTYEKVANLRGISVPMLQALVRDNLRAFVRQSGNDFPA